MSTEINTAQPQTNRTVPVTGAVIAVVGGLAAMTAVAVLRRSRQSNPSREAVTVIAPADVPAVEIKTPTATPAKGTTSAAGRLALVGVLMACLALPFVAEPPLSTLLFIGLAVFSVVVLGRQTQTLLVTIKMPRVQPRALVAVPLVGLAWALVIASALEFSRSLDADLNRAAGLLGLGGLALGAGLLAHPSREKPIAVEAARRPVAPIQVMSVIAGVILLLAFAETSGNLLNLTVFEQFPHHGQFLLLVGGIGLMVWGFGGAPRTFATVQVDQREAILVLAVTLLAFVLRAWRLETLIHHFVDELNFAAFAPTFSFDSSVNLAEPQVMSFPGLWSYWQWWGISVFGRNLAGLRAASVVIGTLTIPALYLLARASFGRNTALVAALLLAAFPAHIHFSRLGLNNIADPLFGTAALGLLAYAFAQRDEAQPERTWAYALAGAMLGLTQYFYEGGRLLYPALTLGWLASLMILRSRRPSLHGMAVMGVTAFAVALPVYYTLVVNNGGFASRMSDVGRGSEYWSNLLMSGIGSEAWTDYLNHLLAPVLVYFSRPEGTLFYGWYYPLLLLPLAIPFLFGVWLLAWRLRTPGASLTLLWLALAPLGVSLLIASDHATRLVVVYPALVLTTAVGLWHGVRLILYGPRLRLACAVLVGVAAVGLALYQTNYYFGEHMARYRIDFPGGNPARDGLDAIFRSTAFPPGTTVHLVGRIPFSEYEARGYLGFLRSDLRLNSISTEQFTDEYLAGLDRTVDHAFYLEPDDLETLALLRAHFDVNAPLGSPYDPPPGEELMLYYAPHNVNHP